MDVARCYLTEVARAETWQVGRRRPGGCLQARREVITTSGETFANHLRLLGALVTPYALRRGMVERVRELAGGAPDFALQTAQLKGVLPDLVWIVDGDPSRVISFSDFR